MTPTHEPSRVAVIVLAAGQGTRMKSSLPKVLHEIAGEPMIVHVRRAVESVGVDEIIAVVGHGAEQVESALTTAHVGGTAKLRTVLQAEQRGTGHAVRTAMEAAPEISVGTVLVLPGDAPVLTGGILKELIDSHVEAGAAVTMLTAVLDDPTGYGRVVRDNAGIPTAIVEHRDADDATRAIREVGTSIYAFDGKFLGGALAALSTDNEAGEEYLTDVVGIAADQARSIAAVMATDPHDVFPHVNDRIQLAEAARVLRDRILDAHMQSGVTILDPATTWIDTSVELEPDVTIEAGVALKGLTRVAGGAVVGRDTTLIDTTVGAGASVVRTHAVQATIGADVSVGPFAYLRPGTVLRAGSRIGTFVEVKNADVGEGSRVPHLTYVGDATIGRDSNIGASSVFVNYDGVNKHRSVIGDHVRTGSDNTFVAPVSVGDGAYTGAGSVIREDVPAGALAVSAGPQRNIEGWVARKRSGTPAAAAAAQSSPGSHADKPAGEREDESMDDADGDGDAEK